MTQGNVAAIKLYQYLVPQHHSGSPHKCIHSLECPANGGPHPFTSPITPPRLRPLPGTSRPRTGPRPYGGRWQRYRLRYLAAYPLCVACLGAGRTTAANTVDHVTPHRGDHKLFWDPSNHQPLCATCHSGDKQRQEKSAIAAYRGCTVDGTPLDPAHRWNARAS